MRRLVAILSATAMSVPVLVSAQDDSLRAARRPPVVTWLDAATLGAGIAGSVALMGVDSRIAKRLQGERYQGNKSHRDITDIAGTVNEKSLFATGVVTYGIMRLVHAPRTTTDIAWHTTESVFITSFTSTLARGILGRSRPFVTADSNAHDYRPGKGFSELRYRAYPSIHAATAFATASALTAETARHSRRAAWIVAPIAYSLASLPGLARMYEDKHWASDILMGAALGTVTGYATVRYHHHRPGNRLDKFFLGRLPVPVAGPDPGLAWRFTF